MCPEEAFDPDVSAPSLTIFTRALSCGEVCPEETSVTCRCARIAFSVGRRAWSSRSVIILDHCFFSWSQQCALQRRLCCSEMVGESSPPAVDFNQPGPHRSPFFHGTVNLPMRRESMTSWSTSPRDKGRRWFVAIPDGPLPRLTEACSLLFGRGVLNKQACPFS